jgi:hypothetical protein
MRWSEESFERGTWSADEVLEGVCRILTRSTGELGRRQWRWIDEP